MSKYGLNIAFFGSSLLSTYRNSVSTYFRGIIRHLHQRGHQVTFYEPDVSSRQQHRDLFKPDWVEVNVYRADEDGVYEALEEAQSADLIIKASDVGVYDELLEAAVLDLRDSRTLVVFWDVNAPATLDRLACNPADPFYEHISRYDLVVTSGGGSIIETYQALGASSCTPIYGALDPQTHYPVPPNPRFQGALGFLGDCVPGYEAQVEEFFLKPAAILAPQRFLLGGNDWEQKPRPDNVTYVDHVVAEDENAFNCSPLAILSVSQSRANRHGVSPPTGLFEAAGAGACVITNSWEGVELFLEPGPEILVAGDGDDVVDYLNNLTIVHAHEIGQAARHRILDQHTYAHRAAQLEAVLTGEKVLL